MRRLVLGATLILTVLVPTLEAQDAASGSGKRVPRRLVYGLVGAAVGAAAAGFYMSAKDEGVTPGLCAEPSCVLTFSLGLGTLVGFTVGREFDQLHSLRYKGNQPLQPRGVSASLTGDPMVLATRGSLVAAGGPGGIQVFTSGERLEHAGIRAAGIRGISALDIIGGTGALVVGSASGFYMYPPSTGPGTLLREGAATAVAASAARIYIATGSRIEITPVDPDTSGGWPGIDVGGNVEALTWDPARNLLWALRDSTLIALEHDGDSLRLIGEARAGFGARRIAVSGSRLAIANGEGGVRLMDVSEPSRPAHLWDWTNARFVYDVSLFEQRMYVASGIEGVYVLDISAPHPSIIGLARELGFATALATNGTQTFVLDRGENVLRRFPSNF